ncbi:MAG: hypothetical protein AB7G93_21450 [Bdellovibrionales bacterium]
MKKVIRFLVPHASMLAIVSLMSSFVGFSVSAFAYASDIVSEHRQRARVDRERTEDQQEEQIKANIAKGNREFREKVYQFSYRYTDNRPDWAQQAVCVADIYTSCGGGMCYSTHNKYYKISVNDLGTTGLYYVNRCYVRLPQDLTCEIYERSRPVGSGESERWVDYYTASCRDAYGRPLPDQEIP